MQQPVQPEFSRRVAWDRVRDVAVELRVEANAQERAALAERFGLLRLDSLSAELTLLRLDGERVRCWGRLRADLAQACVVTLEPVRQQVDEAVELVFSRLIGADQGTIDIAAEDAADHEPLLEGQMEVGESIAQQLAVSLDPYPRRPDAAWEPAAETPEPEKNPFAALAKTPIQR